MVLRGDLTDDLPKESARDTSMALLFPLRASHELAVCRVMSIFVFLTQDIPACITDSLLTLVWEVRSAALGGVVRVEGVQRVLLLKSVLIRSGLDD